MVRQTRGIALTNASAPAAAKIGAKASCASRRAYASYRGCMCLLFLTATRQVCTGSLKAELYTDSSCEFSRETENCAKLVG